MATLYNFIDSLSRIDDTMSSKIPEKTGGAIPNVEDISYSTIYLPQATVIHVRYEIVSDMWNPVDKKYELPVIQSFISEVIFIGSACTCCKDIIVTGDYLQLIYDTSLKTELNEALDDAARFRTMAMVVSKKAKQHGYPMIKASIGMDYGAVSMLPVNLRDSRFPRFLWKGEAIECAKHNAGWADDNIVISEIVWKNLTENNRKLFETDSLAFSSYYKGKVVNIAMNNWVVK